MVQAGKDAQFLRHELLHHVGLERLLVNHLDCELILRGFVGANVDFAEIALAKEFAHFVVLFDVVLTNKTLVRHLRGIPN